MPKITRKIITVRGSFRFPLDMLRYDHCWPKSEGDSNKILATFDDPTLPPQLVELYTDNPRFPKGDRWRSYGWEVFSVEKEA